MKQRAMTMATVATLVACSNHAPKPTPAPAPTGPTSPTPVVYTGALDAARIDKARLAVHPLQPWREAEPILLAIVGRPLLVEDDNAFWGFTTDDGHCTELEVDRTDNGNVGERGTSGELAEDADGYVHCLQAAGKPLPPPPGEDQRGPGPPANGTVAYDDVIEAFNHAKAKWASAKVHVTGPYFGSFPQLDRDSGKVGSTLISMRREDAQFDLICRVAGKIKLPPTLKPGDDIVFNGTLGDDVSSLDDCSWTMPAKARHPTR